jgi:hypothetical protein
MRTAVGAPGRPPAEDAYSGTPTHVNSRPSSGSSKPGHVAVDEGHPRGARAEAVGQQVQRRALVRPEGPRPGADRTATRAAPESAKARSMDVSRCSVCVEVSTAPDSRARCVCTVRPPRERELPRPPGLQGHCATMCPVFGDLWKVRSPNPGVQVVPACAEAHSREGARRCLRRRVGRG